MTADIQRAVLAVADVLDEHADALAKLDSVAGDGDLGITAKNVALQLRSLPLAEGDSAPSSLLELAGFGISEAAPSSFGTLLALGLIAAAAALRDQGDRRETRECWHTALSAACEAVMKSGGAERGQKTVLDAALPAVDALADESRLSPEALVASARAARAGADASATMTAQIGRAGRSADRSSGHVDAGAEFFAIAWDALVGSLTT